MKVLFIQDSLGTGGAEKSNSELWYFLREQKVTVKIIVLEHRQKGIESEILSAGFDVTFIDQQNFWQQVNSIARMIKEYQPDIVHSVLFKATIRTRLAKFKTRFFHIESLVNTPYTLQRFKDPKVSSLGFCLYYAIDFVTGKFGVNHFHANGETVLRHYQKYLLISRSKMTLINRGRKKNQYLDDHKAIAEIRNELNTLNQFQIVIVGRQEFQKGIDTALKAISLLKKDTTNFKLILVGRDGNHTKVIKEIIQHENLEEYVVELGHRHDVSQILAASDLFLFPSRFEGFPGVLVEALSSGLPIVCSNISNNYEIVEEGKNGLFFELDNPSDCCEKIKHFMGNLNEMDEIKDRNLLKFNELYLIEEINLAMYKMYQSIIL